ncbi:DNA protecting protein DprA [Marinilactibacillus sp. 15R]|uniref:DNA processing protein n=1 Tax=Marinilactibacillus piezotolerans TaxID=258723 RepID=A0A1I3UQ19_9LACT|nr:MULTISPECIES: DNA-processing protein DprA [Marinilactibacillus]API89484.1 DNA protecting protein DprA [Marinilactibacillus sp. 15R]SFJ83961.1 DNA processing protein [Marinilactibacillus piezotolerans]
MLIDQFEEHCFILAHYTKMSIEEKWSFLQDLLLENGHCELDLKPLKKLSFEKKASFLEFKNSFYSRQKKVDLSKLGVGWITILDEQYPIKLKEIYLPPLVLFYKGNIEWIEKSIIGVVGARECTEYGKAIVRRFVPPLIEKGIIICSGLAKGIDAYSHISAMEENGKTIAVIGTGLDYYYPYSNRLLQKEIENKQLLLTEFPIGSKPLRHHFPLRNRIISGISDGVIVVEAKKRSGSLITAHQALEQNREVYAVPGSIFSTLSEGTNDLIKAGAKMVTSSNDIIEDIVYKNRWYLKSDI